MYQIGEFSKITKISARMIRYYDKEGILKPSFIGKNGYRYYTEKDIDKISKIKSLRRYDFSYDEIKNILATNQDENPKIYIDKLEELKISLNKYEILIEELEGKNKLDIKNRIINNYDVSICNKQNTNAICKKCITNIKDVDVFIESTFNEISRSKDLLTGHYYIMFYESENLDENMCEVEYYQPVKENKEIDGFTNKYIEESLYISTIHYGTYDMLENAYIALYKWAKSNDFIIKGNFMEKYYVDSSLVSSVYSYITEVLVEVSKAD